MGQNFRPEIQMTEVICLFSAIKQPITAHTCEIADSLKSELFLGYMIGEAKLSFESISVYILEFGMDYEEHRILIYVSIGNT
uniref:Uncharacterized protein n=1 Tax=Arundo donax TaxID=35708 RepID=A0A0A9A2S0_ARUDO